jgi:hypothetical protein
LGKEEFTAMDDHARTMLIELLPKAPPEYRILLPMITEDFKTRQTQGVVFVR